MKINEETSKEETFSEASWRTHETLYKTDLRILLHGLRITEPIQYLCFLRWLLRLSWCSWPLCLFPLRSRGRRTHKGWALVTTARHALRRKLSCSRRWPKSSRSHPALLALSWGCTSTTVLWGYVPSHLKSWTIILMECMSSRWIGFVHAGMRWLGPVELHDGQCSWEGRTSESFTQRLWRHRQSEG